MERSPVRVSTFCRVTAEVTEPGQPHSCGQDGCKLLGEDLGNSISPGWQVGEGHPPNTGCFPREAALAHSHPPTPTGLHKSRSQHGATRSSIPNF